MKRIEHGYDLKYWLTEDGKIYDESVGKCKEANKQHMFCLKRTDGKFDRIALKVLYRLVYNSNYCIDNIENITDEEEWKYISNTNNMYMCSSEGRIKSLFGYESKILKTTKNHQGYHRVDIVIDGNRKTKQVHRLVCETFLGLPSRTDMQIHHKNGQDDNRLKSLCYVTPSEHKRIHKEMAESTAARINK